MPSYQQHVSQWPEELIRVLELETEALVYRFGLGLEEARLMAYTRMVMGRVRLPLVQVRLDSRGRPSRPVGGLPAPIEWVEPARHPQLEQVRLAAG